MDTPAWVCDPDGRVTFINRSAGSLLSLDIPTCIGEQCHEVFRSRHPDGKPMCKSSCALFRAARRGEEIEPLQLCIDDSAGQEKHLHVLAIHETAPDGRGPYLVHCGIEQPYNDRAVDFLHRIAYRSVEDAETVPGVDRLTKREREILGRLADDQSQFEISSALGVSHATVRNHVQHILGKLEVHSIIEAVARYLLREDESIE